MWRNLFRLRLVLGLLILGLALLGKVTKADALVPDTVTTKAPQVTEFLYRGGATPTVPGCGGTCDDLWLSEHRPMPNQTASKDLHRELNRLRWKAGLSHGFRALGKLSLGATAGQLGWTIGTGIREQFIEAPAPGAGGQTWMGDVAGVSAIEKGDLIWGKQWPGTTDYYRFESPITGWRATTANESEIGYEQNTYDCAGFRNTPPDPVSGWGWAKAATPGPCVVGGGGSSTPHGLLVETAPSPPVPYTGQAVAKRLGDKPDPGAAVAQQSMLDELNNNPGAYPTVIPWLDNQLGGPSEDPTTNYATVPNPEPAEVATVYAQRLDQLGFTNVVTTVLSPEAADLTLPADAVVGVDPAGGSRVELATEVKIAANPAEADMPRAVPAALSGETADAYRERLASMGLLGRTTVLTDPNPDYGPNEVTSTSPTAGTRVAQGSEVEVRSNPSTAPAPSAGASPGGCGLTAPTAAFDGSPLTNANLGSKAPFALVGWLGSSTAGLASGGTERPQASFSALGATVNLGFLANFDPIIGVLRLALTFLLWIGVAWFLYGRTIGRDT
jgi:hypothetical protein